jgi:malate dehydrogenase
MDDATIAKISKRTQDAGGEVVALLKTGSAFVSPAEASIEMAEAVLFDQKRVLPAAAYLSGEYGHKDFYFGVPVVIGSKGVERVLELELDSAEQALLDTSAAAVKALVAAAKL